MSQTQTRPAAADKANSSARQQSKSSSVRRTTKSQKDAVSFVLPIDGRYRLTAEELCWRIEKRRNDDQWRPVEYHTSLEAAATSLSGRLLRISEVRCIADALAAADCVSRKLTLALAPRFKVKVRRNG